MSARCALPLPAARREGALADLGYTTFGSSPAAFASLIAHDIEKWAKVVKFAGIKPD